MVLALLLGPLAAPQLPGPAAAEALEAFVSISSPSPGQTLDDTYVSSGRYGEEVDSDTLELVVTNLVTGDVVPFYAFTDDAENTWATVIEPGAIPDGVCEFEVSATTYAAERVEQSLLFRVDARPDDAEVMRYRSSVDGEVLTSEIFVPEDIAESELVPMYVQLHGGGGTGIALYENGHGSILEALEERDWIGLGPDGREWGLFDPEGGCLWRYSAAYVDPYPGHAYEEEVGPGEQDILDAIDAAVERYPVDPDRIYLGGASMGGRGALGIALRNPDRFAALAASNGPSDMWDIYIDRNDPCKEAIAGGKPDDGDPAVDTMYMITSGRFLVENACNLPVFRAHGTDDEIAWNVWRPTDPGPSARYLHAWHFSHEAGWDQPHDRVDLDGIHRVWDFGHTPTLLELQTLHPGHYEYGYLYTNSQVGPDGHNIIDEWYPGFPVVPVGDPDEPPYPAWGTVDPADPARYLGVFPWLDTVGPRSIHPDRVVYKTYTGEHRDAYWASIEVTDPWQNLPGAVRALRDRVGNRLAVELSRVHLASFDLAQAQLLLDPANPLSLELARLDEPVFDPALESSGPLVPWIELRGDFSGVQAVEVLVNGAPLPLAVLAHDADRIRFAPGEVAAPLAIEVRVR